MENDKNSEKKHLKEREIYKNLFREDKEILRWTGNLLNDIVRHWRI